MHDIGLGGSCGLPDAINDRGQVVGFSNPVRDAETHAFLWDDGRAIDIGTLGGTFGEATAINESGDVVGQATIADGELHAFFWRHGVMADLGPLPGFGDSTCVAAFGINSLDQVVGQAVQNFCTGPEKHAFLWERGNMTDLNVFVPPGSTLTLTEVFGINDREEISVSGTLKDGNSRAFLLIPCDENHQGIEDCDFSEVEESASAIGSRPVAQSPTTANPWISTSSMWRSLGRRSMPVYRNLGVQPPPK